MNRRMIGLSAIAVAIALMASPLRAQWVVFDPSNYAEAVLHYEQLVQQYQLLLQQAKRLTNRRATDCKPLRQLVLARELRPGKKLLHANRLDKLITNLDGERASIARHLK